VGDEVFRGETVSVLISFQVSEAHNVNKELKKQASDMYHRPSLA
jgi:hypothetical protein